MPLNAATEAARLSIAPMMDWTDRHCRYLHRLLSRRALLYTEMVTAPAVIHGDRERLLGFDPAEHPVALQLGGSDPEELCARRGHRGRGRIRRDQPQCRLPVGPGAVGVFRRRPYGTARPRRRLRGRDDRREPVEVTVKCRIGVDEQDPGEGPAAISSSAISEAGVRRVAIHARKAWLQGLSPKENRDVPPLDCPLVHRMKADFPHLHLSINGGIGSLAGGAGPSRGRDGRRDDRAGGLSHAGRHPRAGGCRDLRRAPRPGAAPRRSCLPCCPISRRIWPPVGG
jgi:tRNA-dihydrouridine synthase A